MAVSYIVCDKCGKKYSALNNRCPNCGSGRAVLGTAAVIVRLLAIVFALLFGALNFVKLGAQDVTYFMAGGFWLAALAALALPFVLLFIPLSLANPVWAIASDIVWSALFVLKYLAVTGKGVALGTTGVLLWIAMAACFALAVLNIVFTYIALGRDRERAMRDTMRTESDLTPSDDDDDDDEPSPVIQPKAHSFDAPEKGSEKL